MLYRVPTNGECYENNIISQSYLPGCYLEDSLLNGGNTRWRTAIASPTMLENKQCEEISRKFTFSSECRPRSILVVKNDVQETQEIICEPKRKENVGKKKENCNIYSCSCHAKKHCKAQSVYEGHKKKRLPSTKAALFLSYC
jgi:hypothetical protein